MAWWNKKDDDEAEETGSASSRVVDAVRNLYQRVVDNQRRAVEADQAVARETARQVTSAPKAVFNALDRATQSTAQANMTAQRAQTQRVQDAARNIYGAYQQQQERAARDQMAEQARQRQAQQQRMQAATAALYRQSQIQQQANRNQAETMAGLYTSAADSLRGANELYQRQLAGTDTGNRANELMTQPVLQRANKRQSSLESGDPNTGAGKYIKYLTAADFRENSLPKTDVRDETYNYINDLNDARERQQGYAAQRGADSGLEKYQMMTDSERGVYNYLYNTQGKTSAEGFLARIEPELNEQYYSGQSAWMSEQANRDTASRIGFTAATVGAQPVRTLSGAAALIEDVIRSDEDSIDPNSEFRRMSALTQDIRGAIAQHYDEQYPNGILGMSGGEIYNTIMSALDSTMNAAVAGTVGQAAGAIHSGVTNGMYDINKILAFRNKLGSAMMSSEVAASAVAESKQKGYSDVGAVSLGLVRGYIEYMSEKIGGEWAIGWMKKNPLNPIKTILHTIIPEGVEELMSDFGNEAVNIILDNSFNTDESYILQAKRYFEKNGSANPWRDTLRTIWTQEKKSFIGGALAALGTGTVNYALNRGAINEAATRLHTDGEGIVKVMEDMDTDNPSAVDRLARLTGADSVEALKERYEQVAEAFGAKSLDDLNDMIEQAAEDGENIDERMRAVAQGQDPESVDTVQPETVRETTPGNEGLRSEFAARVAEPETAQIAPERQAAVGQAAQDIRNAAQQGMAPPIEQYEARTNENAPQERSALDVNTEGVLNNGEQSDNRGPELGNDALGAGGEALNNEAGAQRGTVDAGHEVGQRRDRFQNYGVKETVTPAALGVNNGSSTQNVEVLDESTFAEGSPEAMAAQQAREAGLEPVFIRGTMDIGGKRARAYINGNRVILQADGDITADKLLRHERYHQEALRNPKMRNIMRQALKGNMTAPELTGLITRYIQAYDGVYDFSQMTRDQIVEICEEELFADLYAGIDNTGNTQLREVAQLGFDEAQQEGEYSYPRDADALYTQPDLYSYDFLTHQKEMQKIKLPSYDTVKNLDRDTVAESGLKEAEQYGSRDGDYVLVENGYSKHILRISKNSITHSIDGKKSRQILNSQLGLKAGELAKNAVPINGLTKENPQAKGTYAMAAYTYDDKGNVYIAILTVDHFGETISDIQAVDVTHAINGRIKKGRESKIGNSHRNLSNDISDNTFSDTISIADLLDVVNNTHQGILSNDVLKHLGETKPEKGYYAKRSLFSVDVPIGNPKWNGVEEAAVDHFGTTNDFRTAGYLLRDGRMLDFSGAHWLDGYSDDYIADWRKKNDIRQVDHEDIFEAFESMGDDFPNDSAREFIRRGNIRMVPEGPGLEISAMTEPSAEQYAKIREFIRTASENGNKYNSTRFNVDLMRNRQSRAGTLSYSGKVNADKVVNDIKHFYQTGEVREQSPLAQFRYSVEVPGDLRQQLAEAEQEYMRATEANDPDYDYRGQLDRINELRRQVQEAEQAGNTGNDSQETVDKHPERGEIGSDGLRVCKDTDALEAELNDAGAARFNNDTGEYKARIRQKSEGGVLLTVDRDGKRAESKTFGTAGEAAAYAASFIDGQTQARNDAELDNEKSTPVPKQEPIEALTTGKVQDEAKRQKQNKAAEASTQSLRDRIRKTDEEIKALRRLEKTTGLTDTQKAHLQDLQETLEILNDELTSRKGRAKAKKEKVEVKGNKPVRSAAEAKNVLFDTFHTAQGQRIETGQKIDTLLSRVQNEGRITEQDRQDLFDMLLDAGAVREEATEELKDVRDWLRGARIYVSEQDRADFGDDWNTLRKRAFAAGIYLTNNETDRKADSLNAELAETFGENMFPTDGALSDMLANMIDKAEDGKSRLIPFAQAIESEAKGEGVDAQEIYNELSAKLDETLRTFAEKAKLEVELKDRTASMLATERKRAEDRLERMAQRRRESQIREKTFKAIRRLKKLRGKAAADVKTQIDEAIRDIDTQARQLTINGIEDLQELARVYEDAKKAAGYVDAENPGNFISNPYIEEKLARLTQKHINDMDIDEVIELGRVVSALENTVKNNGKMIGEQFDAEVKTVADQVDDEVRSSRGAKPGFLQKWFAEEQLSPRRFLEMLGGWKKGAMANLADSLEKGQTRMLDFQRRAAQLMDPFMSKKENRKWLKTASGKNAKWYTYSVANGLDAEGGGITGQTIEITPMMKVSLYLASQNEDNLRHIQTGGLVIPDKALYMKGKTQEAFAQGKRVKMQPEAVRHIAASLTQEEKTFAGYLQKFFNTTSKDAINEVSVQLDGFERADVEQYFPIESSKAFLKSDVSGEARAQTVEGIGSIANERVHASNPIVLDDAYNVFMRQVDKVSRYYGYAIPVRNFNAVNNYVFHEKGNAFAGSIKDTINHKWGAGAENYITKMLQDIQSGVPNRGDMTSRFLSKLRGNLAGATLTLNPSVAISQTASYPGAAQAVGWDGLAAGLVGGPVDEKLVEKYTPLLWYRSQGYSTQEIGDAVSAQNKSLAQKALSSKALNWIQTMDRLAVKRIWKAAEYRVTKDTGLKPGSRELIDSGMDPFYQKVAEVFNRAVYDTQPNYTDMERAQILRSESDITKFLTMYKTVPLQYYGMTAEAVGRMQAALKSGDKAEIHAARKYAADTFGGLLAANSVYVIMKALFKSFRGKDKDYRDEEGEITADSYFKQLGRDLMETYAGSVIGGAEAYSLITGWVNGDTFRAPEINVLSSVEDIANGFQSIFKAIDDDDPGKTAKAVKDAAENIAMVFGLPVKNVETYLMASIRRIQPEAAMQYDNFFGGLNKGDLKGMDADTIGSAAGIIMNSRTGANLERTATDELSRLYAAGFTDAIPTAIPDSFEYGGNTVKIKDRGAYRETWGGTVGDNLEELITSKDYRAADDKTKQAMIRKLYQYATVQARMGADPEYTAEGNSTYGWTVKADEAMDAGIDLPTAIGALTTFGTLKADKDSTGKTTVSKKDKVCAYIDALDIDNEQKDLLYELAGYEMGLENAPWHGGPGAKTGKITVPKSQEAAYKQFVDEHRKALTESAAYQAADEAGRKALEKRLQEYAAVQAMRKVNPDYNAAAEGYGWTKWADQAQKVGISLTDAIGHMTALGALKADYDKFGKAITGSKKDKVCAYIEALHLTNDQKDALYLSVYKENSLKYTPWHGYKGGKKRRRSRRRGGRRRSGGSTSRSVKQVGMLAKGYSSNGIDVSALFGVSGSGRSQTQNASAASDLLEIINKHYGGNALAAAMDGGKRAKGRTTVDFKL